MRDMVVVINLDGAACFSTARKLRAEHIYCKIMPPEATVEEIIAQGALGVLLAGGETGVPAEIPHLEPLLAADLPVLAMGDAALALAEHLGGAVVAPAEEGSRVTEVRFGSDPLFASVENNERYLPAPRTMTLSSAMASVAETDDGVIGFRAGDKLVYGLAFQVEQNDPDGVQLLINFCHSLCGCTLWWSTQAFIDRATDEIARNASGYEAICALSGGVDSGVCAMLGHKALKNRLHCIFIDTGLLRKDEGDRVTAFYRDEAGLNFRRIDARGRFIEALRGVTSPQKKEQIIYDLLKSILEDEISRLMDVGIMLQGTNYIDTLGYTDEPNAAPAGDIQLLEPVRELFKDEIRDVGETLGLPPTIIRRQPFPGTGLALRIHGEITEEKLRILREADAIFRAAIEDALANRRPSKYFATLSDNLACEAEDDPTYIITLRAVQPAEGAAAMASRLPSDLLERVTEDILRTQPAVARVLYDLSPSYKFAHIDAK